MAATTTTLTPDLLVRTYTKDKHFEQFAQLATPFWTELEKAEAEIPAGQGLYFDIWLADAHATASIAEAGDLPATGQPTVVTGSVTAIQTFSSFGVSELFLEASKNGGSIGIDAINRHVQMCTRDLMFEINRQALTSHGTGRMGVVQTTTVTLTTVVMRNPEGVLQFREGMKVDAYDTDTGGSKQGSTLVISDVNIDTRTLTFTATASLTAGWGLYRAASTTVSAYGIAMNGLRGEADNGPLQATIFGLSRSTYPGLNATVLTAGGGTQPWSEALLRKAAHRATLRSGAEITDIWTNYGVLSEHLNQTVSNTIYDAGTGPGVPTYDVGYKKLPSLLVNGRSIPYRIDGVLPAREMILVPKSILRKHVLRDPSWVGDDTGRGGSASPVLMQQPGTATGNYATAKIAGQGAMMNQTCKMPKQLVRITEIADAELAGDPAPTS